MPLQGEKQDFFALKIKSILCQSPEGVSVRTTGAGIGETLIAVQPDSDKLFILRELLAGEH